MYRIFIILICSATLSLAACQKEPPVAQPQNPAASAPSPSASTEPTTVQPESPVAASTPLPPAVSEMDDDAEESVESAPNAPQALSLKQDKMGYTPLNIRFKEGTHFQRLVPTRQSNAPLGQVEVVEAFWYGCPHCAAFDPKLEAWRTHAKPAYVSFTRLPIMWSDRAQLHARLFYTLIALDKLASLHEQIFNAIHVENTPLDNEDDIAVFLKQHGIPRETFTKAFHSSAVETQLKRAETLNQHYRITSVPTLIIDGKYVTDLEMAGGSKEALSLVNELAAKAHGG